MSIGSLTELDLAHRAEYGGKAAHLGHAARLGCPVLRGVALSTGLFQRFVEQGGLLGEVSSILNTMQPRTMHQFQAAAWAIQSAFRVRRMPTDVRNLLLEAWESVDAERVSVRSSATNEDSPQRSFVGQHVSTLDVASEDALVDAALACWASLFSAKSLAYAQRFGVDLLSSSMGLVIQPMIDGESHGALFTADPITGDPDRFVLEIYKGHERGLFDLDPYARRPGELPYWSQLRHYGLLLDEHDLAYQAIEWMICDQELYFLRVRPATAIPDFLPARELPPELSVDLKLVAPAASSQRALEPLSRYHLSRLGLGETHAVQRSGLLDEVPGTSQSCGYLYCADLADQPSSPPRRGGLPILIHSLRGAATASHVEQDITAHMLTLRDELTSLLEVSLDSEVENDLTELLLRVQHTGDALSATCLQSYGVVDELIEALRQMYQEWAQTELIPTTLLGDANHVSSRQDARERRSGPGQLSDMLITRDILRDSSLELPITDIAKGAVSVNDVPADQDLPRWQRALSSGLVERARRLHGLSKEALDAFCRCRDLEKRVILEIGRRLLAAGVLSQEEDAILLEARELDRWLRGELQDEQMMRWIIRRRDDRRRAWRYSPPAVLQAQEPAETPDRMAGCDIVLQGRAVSGGVVSGPARVVRSLRETSSVLPGEVLVCTEAAFELSPLFSTVAAVVAETGTLLDAGSVLVREYGLPAVFSVEGALDRLSTGDQLVIDAVRGVVGRQRAPRRSFHTALDELNTL